MSTECFRPGEPEDAAVPVSSESISHLIAVFREENDTRLVAVMDRLRAALNNRLSEGSQRDHIHVFQYTEGEHNRLLFVGPTPLGLGISEQSLSVTKYHASSESPREREAIIGQTVFVYSHDELASVAQPPDLENTSTAIIHFPARTWQAREALLLEQPDMYGYVHGRAPVADDRTLLQKGVSISGRTGFAYTSNKREGRAVDVLAIAEDLASVLEDENTQFVESRPMDFDPARG